MDNFNIKSLNKHETEQYNKLKNLQAESGVISTLLHNPKFIFYSENLESRDFFDETNACLFWAIKQIVDSGVYEIDDFNISNAFASNNAIQARMDKVGLDTIKSIMELSNFTARNNEKEYKELVKDVKEFSNRRKLFLDLKTATSSCLNSDVTGDELQKITFDIAEKYNMNNSTNKEIKKFSEKVDSLWQEIQDRQSGKLVSIPFHIKELNEYVTMEAGELIIFGANAKEGKSAMLLSSTVDLLKRGLSVLVIDSELSDRLYMLRMIAHVSQVPFKIVKDGTANEEQLKKINEAKDWLKTVNLYHEYMPIFDDKGIMMLFKRINCLNKVDVCVVDYFKQTTGADAFSVSLNLSGLVNTIKNELAGVYNIPVLSAIQTTKNGEVALSSGVIRYCSTLITIRRKTKEEFVSDGGKDYGNTYMSVVINRNGAQQSQGEHISVDFIGDILTYKSAKKQPEIKNPY